MQSRLGAGLAALPGAAWLPHLLLLLSIAMIAGYFVLGRAIHAEVPAIGAVFWRSLIGLATIALFFARALKREGRRLAAHWRLLLVLGLLQGVSGHVCVLYGLQSTTAVNAGLIAATQPALTALAAWILWRDGLSARQIAGLAIAVAGVLPIVSRGDVGALLALELASGDLLLQIAMVSFAFYNAGVKRTGEGLSPFVALFGILAGTGDCNAAALCRRNPVRRPPDALRLGDGRRGRLLRHRRHRHRPRLHQYRYRQARPCARRGPISS